VKAVAGTSPEADRERIGEAEQRLETYWLGLRTDAGLSVDGLAPAQEALVATWAARGWTKSVEPTVALNAEGWLLLDRLAVELDEAATG
jgi:coproporphyrinogen III oxidase-like Fe-S oxidoreductase